jgi:sugar lactone lactonase YvrE
MKYNVNDTTGVIVAGNLTAGNSSNQLCQPKGVAVDRFRFLIVADSSNYRIQNFSNSSYGTTIVMGNSTIPFGQMRDLHIDSYNNIYVTDSDNAQIIKFSFNNKTDIVLSTSNGSGSGTNQFLKPCGNFIDVNQSWYVVDSQNHRVQQLLSGTTTFVTVAGISNINGPAVTQLSNPVAVVVDDNGYVFK